jgi:DNA-directed RNA polymerase subunit N (RpoN/RPB10)
MEISEYYRAKKEGRWEAPSYRERCALCGGRDCAVKDGQYFRQALDEKGRMIKDLGIQRYKCCRRGKAKKAVTFSLLVDQLMPYSKYPIRTATGILTRWKEYGGNIGKALETVFMAIENISDELLDTGESQVYRFVKTFKNACQKYTVWKKLNRGYSLESFIQLCGQKECLEAEAMSMSYYAGNGGYRANSQFLFGKASQFRKSRH